MGYYKIYKNLKEFEIVEGKTISDVQNHIDYLPFRIVPCEEDGKPKLPTGYSYLQNKTI